MSTFRCPHCGIAMTDEEIATGVCPVCDVVVDTPKPVAAPAKKFEPEMSPGYTMPVMIGIALSAVAFCLLPIGLMFYFSLPERKPDDKEAEQPPRKTAPVVLAKKSPSKRTTSEVVETKTNDAPRTETLKKEEPKTKVELKTEEPKKVEPKTKDEPKKEEPKVAEKKPMPKEVVELKVKQPDPKGRFINLPLMRDDAIKIDGDLADWKDVPPILLHGVERGKAPKKAVHVPASQKAWVAYCPRGILVAIDVVDTSGELENLPKPATGAWPFWDNDAIEVYLDTLNLRANERGQENAHQFVAFPFGVPGDDAIGGYESRILKRAWTIVPHASSGKTPMLRAGKRSANGWTLELLIPKHALRHADLKPGQIIGFELQVDTGTNIFYQWANHDPRHRISTNPSLWGEAILGGADAVLEVLDGDRKPLAMLTPGQPIHVRVTDADRNLSPDKKDKIEVTLTSKSGDRKVVALEETEPNSGVFAGAIATRLETGKQAADILEVQAGEMLVIEYRDPIRADGARNVTTRKTLEVRR